MIKQNYLFHVFVTENISRKNINDQAKKYVGGSSAIPRVFWGILVSVPGSVL